MPLATGDVRSAFEAGQMSRVVRLASAALAEQPDNGRIWEMLGIAQIHCRGDREAIDALERASLLVPLSTRGRICLARCYGSSGRHELSRDLLMQLLDNGLASEELLAVAAALDAVDQPGLAMKACRRAASVDADLAPIYYDMGYYAARCGYRPHVSEALARKAISLDPSCVHFRVGLASLLLRQSRGQEALELVEDFSPADFAHIRCRCCLERLADLYESGGDEQRAQLCQQQTDSLDPCDENSDCA